MPQLPKVDCRYGAPMGRSAYGRPHSRVRLFHLRLDSGGYDDGGAYWGHGTRIWCALGNSRDHDGTIEEGGYRAFVRAHTRAEAAKELGLTGAHLIVPIRDTKR